METPPASAPVNISEYSPIPIVPEASSLKRHIIMGAGITLAAQALFSRQNGNISSTPINSDWSVRDTLKMGLISAGAEVISVVAPRLVTDRKFGNPGVKKLWEAFKKKPVATAALITVAGPAIEEGLFRLVPSELADRLDPKNKDAARWPLGVATAGLFAAAHIIKAEKSGQPIMIPLPQFVAGLFSWHIQRQGGYKYSFAAHAIHNSIPTLSLLGMLNNETARTTFESRLEN